jgi:hypothetical protein
MQFCAIHSAKSHEIIALDSPCLELLNKPKTARFGSVDAEIFMLKISLNSICNIAGIWQRGKVKYQLLKYNLKTNFISIKLLY